MHHITNATYHRFLFSNPARKMTGFSLIELMITVTIIGILSAIAIPSYQRYIDRARFMEIIMLANAFKIATTLAIQEGYPIDELTTGVYGIPDAPAPTKNLANLSINEGIITATAADTLRQLNYILTPTIDGSNWQVSGSCVKAGLCHE